MERLTINEVIEHCKRQTHEMEKYNSKELLETGDIGFTGMKRYWEHRQVEKWLEELKAYRTAEEQGLLLRLPCPIGIEVWTIMCGMTGKHPTLFKQSFEYSMIEHFGKAVFLTKEEAEQKLKEMESDK